MPRPTTIALRGGICDDALAMIRLRHADDLSVEEVARAIHTSRRQLQRCLADHGTTFSRELTRARMEAARHLLGERITIAEVARRVGYSQPAQFAKSFRAYHGVLPSEVRRRYAGSTAA